MDLKCTVYRSARKANTYLYLKNGVTVENLPDDLQALLGEITQVLDLDLSKTKKLAQVSPKEVIKAFAEQGYFLQLPPADILLKQTPQVGFVE